MCVYFPWYSKWYSGLVLFFFLLIPVVVSAQFRIGPKLGAQMGRAVYEDEAYKELYSSSFRPGLQLGAVLNYKVSDFYSLHTELYYSQKGKRSKNKVEMISPTDNKALYSFIDVPVLLRFSKHQTTPDFKIEYYLNVGPSINYWLGGHGTIQNEEYSRLTGKEIQQYRIVFKEDAKTGTEQVFVREANRLQMSLDFGGGVIFDLGTGKTIMVDLRNSIGIGKTYMGKEDSGDYSIGSYQDNFEAVNHVFSISVSYLFDVDLIALMQKGRFRR
ncbi:outer membrane beta-barrel protein [Nafulsella turpanensis]|uniref:outer membrane beta-barrel protein n=1 Tax=Nafulsella turpanensis TaxID=1265690 RepID=UPI00037AF178|nr:outer membrane beta-barrel protein [Nafulsella turpanensis]